jgi:hypothetical protein
VLRQKEGKTDGCESFERVDEENRITPSLPQGAQNICCSDIPAPNRTDINPGDTSGKISRREGSEQITKTTNCERKKPHDDELLRVNALHSVVGTVCER